MNKSITILLFSISCFGVGMYTGTSVTTTIKVPSVATGANVTGLATIFKAKTGSAGSYAVGPVANIVI